MRKDAGFSIAVSIVLVVAVVTIGLIMWRLSAVDRPSENTQSIPNVRKSDEDTPYPKADPNAGYLVIKEWGVRLKVGEGLNGLKYFRPNDVNTDAFTFTTDELVAKEPGCSQGIVSGLLTRSKDPSPIFGGVILMIDGFSYQYRGTDAACSENEVNLPLESKTLQSISESIKTLELAK